jgi:hypothetical protein
VDACPTAGDRTGENVADSISAIRRYSHEDEFAILGKEPDGFIDVAGVDEQGIAGEQPLDFGPKEILMF